MMRLRLALPFLALALAACDHHQTADRTRSTQGAAGVAQDDSALTGEQKRYPRALPANLPSRPAPMLAASPTISPVPPPQPTSAADAVPAETAASQPVPPMDSPAPAGLPAVASTPDTTSSTPGSTDATASTPPASTPDANTDASQQVSPPPQVATTPPQQLDEIEAKKQVVVLNTSMGQIVIQLDDVSAPQTCGNFRKLVNSGFYNRTLFHRVIPNFMIQGGDPNSKSDDRSTYGQGDPGYTLPPEIQLKNDVGAVAMARLPDKVNPNRESNGSQFFICVVPCPSLDHQYTVFGHVIKGLDVAEKIADAPRDKRDDPTDRIEMEANIEPKIQALGEASADSK
jgi:cyclophilin family peptidyl-prolyl cis-trans isomerase